MTRKELTDDFLAKIPAFERMTTEERRQLAEIASLHEADAGEVLVHQGKESRRIWILLEGECEVVRSLEGSSKRGKQYHLASLEPFDHFGEMSFFEPHPHSASVTAKSPAKLMRIAHRDYQEMIDGECQSAYKFTYNIVNTLAHRLRRMDDWVTELLAEESQEPSEDQSKPQSEWSIFREKLFGEWNL